MKRHMVVAISAGPFAAFGRGSDSLLTLPVGKSLRIQASGTDDRITVTIEGDADTPAEIVHAPGPVLLRCANLELVTLKQSRKGQTQ